MPVIIGETPSASGDEPLSDHQEVIAGDDYTVADGRALHWSSADFPDLAGAELTFTVGHDDYVIYGNMPASFTSTVPASPDNPSTVYFELTSAVTSTFQNGEYDYQLLATVNGAKVTLAIGKLTVISSPGVMPLYPLAI